MNHNYDSSQIKVIDLSQMSLPEIIREIEARPLMWLPEKHIMYFWTFLQGYLLTNQDRIDHTLMIEFEKHFSNKYQIKTTHGWARNMNHMCSNPHDALDRFFEEFNEFMEVYEQ
ncbi:MAG: hypothetical protein OQK51_23120 [Kangiellaceae bacterium]|nr:hypothetical protein [Kangiellaceae bacterium]